MRSTERLRKLNQASAAASSQWKAINSMKTRQSKTHINTSLRNDDYINQESRIEILAISMVRPSQGNPRIHSKKQIRKIADSIRRFRFINPLIIDEDGNIIAGEGRYRAAISLGMRRIAVIRVSHLTKDELKLYLLADNRIAEDAGWDRQLLVVRLDELAKSVPDITESGFEAAEIDSLSFDLRLANTSGGDEIPPYPAGATVVSCPGDLWLLGAHRLLCGNARDPLAFIVLMAGELAVMAFLDVPYNVRMKGHAGGRGRIKHREFAEASGEMSPSEFICFLEQTLGLCAANSSSGSIHFVCIDWRHMAELLAAGHVYAELKNVCVWIKNNAGQGSFYRSAHEMVFVFKHGDAPHINTFALGQYGRTRSNVWQYSGVNSFRAGRLDELKMHPTVKPLALVVDAMRDCSNPNSIVLDTFVGSGTTIIAAEQIGRRAYCMDIDPGYVDVSVRRWQKISKKDAILAATGQTFDEVEANGRTPTKKFARRAR